MEGNAPEIRTVRVTRYVTPLKEGGSLPAIAEADDDFLYVIKFRGAGQGPKALIAELIGGELARTAGLKVPEIVFAELDEAFGRTEPDPEIQDLLKASRGLNLGLHFLQSAATYDTAIQKVDELLASKIVWLDCFLMNVDRTARNTNLLIWKKEVWLIDHGAALYFHHSWMKHMEKATQVFTQVKDHVLLPFATKLDEAQAWFTERLNEDLIKNIVELIPEQWLLVDAPFDTIEENRKAYEDFLITRLQHSDTFTKHAKDARNDVI